MKGSVGRSESRAHKLAIYAVICIGALPVLLPVYWMVLASIKSRDRISVSPPDWLPLDVEHTIAIADQAIPVTIFDDASASGTGVQRVKLKRDTSAPLRLPRRAIEAVTHTEYAAKIEGVERRVEPLNPPDEAAADDEIPISIPGTRRTVDVLAGDVEEVERTQTFWLVLGEEIPVCRREIELNDESRAAISILDGGPSIEIAPSLREDKAPCTVRWADRQLPCQPSAALAPAGYLTVHLVNPPDGASLIVPVSELRDEVRVQHFIELSDVRREVKPLDVRSDGQLRVELLDEPRRASISRADLIARPRSVTYATILGERRVVETSAPLPDDPQASVPVHIPGAIAIAADRVHTRRAIEPRWNNYGAAWREQNFALYVANTLFIAALVVLGTVLSCGLVGYAFARLEFRGRDALFMLLLATMMIPGQVTSIPQFVMFAKFGWMDSYKPLIVPHFLASSAFFVFLFRQFLLTIPNDLEDAARIDGCGPLGTWWLVMMPLSKPIIITVAVFSFTGVWNDFLAPLLYINSDEKQTVALGLQSFKSAFQTAEPQLIMAASVMMIVPTVLLFFVAQKAFMRGVVVSGVKG